LRERWPQMRCVMLTGSEADEDLFAALAAGAAGYLLKSDSREQIRAALDEVVAGGAPMSRDVARRVMASFTPRAKPTCADCGIRIVGHGLERDGTFFCCATCAERKGVRGLQDRVGAR